MQRPAPVSHRNRTQRGQSAVIVAILLVAMMALLALTFDGGYAYFQRRLAQSAADSGALAGAAVRCANTGDPIETALDYAVNKNAAHQAEASLAQGVVNVTTTITTTTFFASVLGRPNMVVGAAAEAGCFAPGSFTGHVLPMAWACSPPTVDDDDWVVNDNTCEVKYAEPENNYYPKYVIMDSISATEDYYCQDPPNSGQPAGAIDCDLDNDGFNDVLGQGGRSWLDLTNQGGGAADLIRWINGTEVYISTHMWRMGQQGVANSVFQAVGNQVGKELVMPVFDYFCTRSVTPSCPNIEGLWHDEDDYPGGGGTSATWYHIISFSIFHITCVDAPGAGTPPGGCPTIGAAKQAMLDAGFNMGQVNSLKAIEGYFIRGYIPGAEGRPSDGVYGGLHTLYLTR
jgi:Flp pilus assembly protein TadG